MRGDILPLGMQVHTDTKNDGGEQEILAIFQGEPQE